MLGPPAGDGQRVPRPEPRRPDPEARLRDLAQLLVIVGPTAVGKSRIALRVAEQLGGEIVGCDALQVYRGFDRATAKPSDAERKLVPHHLIDVCDPRRDFSLADYVRMADLSISAIVARGGVPVVVGGTGLYLRGLLRGIVAAPARNEPLRERLRAMAARHGPARLHRWLSALDPRSAERIAPADTQRILRALELARSGGETWSERLAIEGTWAGSEERYRSVKVGLDMDRAKLALTIAERVDRFFEAGLVEEVRSLLADGVPETANAFKGIGYREVLQALGTGFDPEMVREEVRRSTRRYAKRQRTWFRKESRVRWLDAASDPRTLSERIIEMWREETSR